MKSRTYFAVLAVFFFSSICAALDQFPGLTLPADPVIQSMVDSVSADSLEAYVRRLEGFYTRRVLTDSHKLAGQWIAQKFSDWSYAVEYDSVWVDSAYYNYTTDQWMEIGLRGYCRSVIAPVKGAVDSQSIYIYGGHYDSYGDTAWTIRDSLYAPAPGAEDNASGTACVMECARVFKGKPWESSIKFIGFGSEELGYSSAHHYAMQAYLNNWDIKGMVGFDMVGTDMAFPDQTVNAVWGERSDELISIYAKVAGIYSPQLVLSKEQQLEARDTTHDFDAAPFYYYGYPAFWQHDKGCYSTPVHSVNDSAGLLAYDYFASLTKAAVAAMAFMSDYPSVIYPDIKDPGDGQSLVVTWAADVKKDIAEYRIYYSQASGIIDSISTGGTCDTITGLMGDSLYHITVRAIDDKGHPSPIAYDYTSTPRLAPVPPSPIIATPLVSGAKLDWGKNTELDFSGYILYRQINSGGYDSITALTDTSYSDSPLFGVNRYYYRIRGYDTDGNMGVLSDSIYCRPITLDQGVLVVDETNNWTTGSFPRDAQQDSFYNYILADYKYEPYEYGSSLQKPILADFGPYSTVAWFADDYATMLASGAVSDLKSYLENGGKLWYAGWKLSGNIHNTTTYPADYSFGDIAYDHFKMTHAEISGTTDSFKTAVGLRGYPDIMVDTLKYPSTIWGKVFRNIEALTPLAGADTIYVMDMRNNSSLFEGRACAVRDSGKVVLFGFPLYYMDRDQAKAATQRVLAEFGEPYTGVEGRPGNWEQITDLRLHQNSPNPFSQQTNISYQLPKAGLVKLCVYNIAGQLVRTLVQGEQPAGNFTIKWDGRDNNNLQVSNGVYVYKLDAAGLKGTKKMLLLR